MMKDYEKKLIHNSFKISQKGHLPSALYDPYKTHSKKPEAVLPPILPSIMFASGKQRRLSKDLEKPRNLNSTIG